MPTLEYVSLMSVHEQIFLTKKPANLICNPRGSDIARKYRLFGLPSCSVRLGKPDSTRAAFMETPDQKSTLQRGIQSQGEHEHLRG